MQLVSITFEHFWQRLYIYRTHTYTSTSLDRARIDPRIIEARSWKGGIGRGESPMIRGWIGGTEDGGVAVATLSRSPALWWRTTLDGGVERWRSHLWLPVHPTGSVLCPTNNDKNLGNRTRQLGCTPARHTPSIVAAWIQKWRKRLFGDPPRGEWLDRWVTRPGPMFARSSTPDHSRFEQ